MNVLVSPAFTLPVITLRPSVEWTKTTVCGPGETWTPTFGVGPRGRPFRMTFVTGIEFMLSTALPDCATREGGGGVGACGPGAGPGWWPPVAGGAVCGVESPSLLASGASPTPSTIVISKVFSATPSSKFTFLRYVE